MKCMFVCDAHIDIAAMDDKQKAKVKWRPRVNRHTGKKCLEAYFPAGTEYEHENAFHFVDVGMALPADAECEAACVPLTPEARKTLEMNYQANAAGVHAPEDRELFMAGVIVGYETIDGKLTYKAGPNYAAWSEAQEKLKAADSDI